MFVENYILIGYNISEEHWYDFGINYTFED